MTDDVLIEEISGGVLSAEHRHGGTDGSRPRARRARPEDPPGQRRGDPRGQKREGRLTSTSTACSTPTSIVAWRPTGRGRSSTTSTLGARWTGCT